MDFKFLKFRLTVTGRLEITYYDEDMAAWRPAQTLSAEEAHGLATWLHTMLVSPELPILKLNGLRI